jgi:hypothetical protein
VFVEVTTMASSQVTGRPVNQVYIDDWGKVAVVEECVLCGETHRHGAADPTLAAGGQSPRAAHCAVYDAEYCLALAEDADPPAHWWRRMGEVIAR